MYIYIYICIYIYIYIQYLPSRRGNLEQCKRSNPKARTPHGRDFDSLHDHTTNFLDLQNTEDNRVGRLCGGTNVLNQ